MFKYAFMSSSAPEWSLDELIEQAGQYGYAGIEPRIEWGHAHGIEPDIDADARAAVKRKFADSPIELCCIATGCRYSDPADRQEHIDHTHRCIDLAGDTASPRLRVFGGNLGEGIGREQAIAQVADALEQVADHARERGVTICLETHDAWCEPDHVAAVLRKVDHPNVAVNWDVMHTLRVGGQGPAEAYRTLGQWVAHTHIHDATWDEQGRFTQMRMGAGWVEQKSVLEVLRDGGYDGYLSGEWIKWQPPDEHLPREIERLREIEATLS